MIQEFSVENFRSIKSRQTISFLASNKMNSDADDYLCVKVNETTRLLKFGILYGYNAAGKSNILLAFDFLRKLVLSGPETKDQETELIPFAMCDKMTGKPGRFSLVFYIGSTRYEYSVSLDSQRIHEESLHYSPEGRIAKLFSRIYDRENKVSRITIGSRCSFTAKEKTILSGNTLENMTVLFAYQKSNINSDELDKVTRYFRETLLPSITPKVLLKNWSLEKLSTDSSRKDFYVKLLEKADFQISGLEIRNERIDVTENLLRDLASQGAPQTILDKLNQEKKLESKELFFVHATKIGKYQISADDESQGTLRYFGLGGVLKELLTAPHFVTIDEIESSLHPELITFFLQMFLMNTTNSQIFATTHAQTIMDQDYMRNDMVWFCEKNEEGASCYYSAQDFKLHKNISLANFYRAGKLGATPVLGSPIIQGENH